MNRFVQLHLLTSYPPANLNRDDLGRPKTAVMGGVPRLRISSQSLKRAWRTSDIFKKVLNGHIGTRTKRIGFKAFKQLREKGITEKDALEWARGIASVFGSVKGKKEKGNSDELNEKTLAEQMKEETKEPKDALEWAKEIAGVFGTDKELTGKGKKAFDRLEGNEKLEKFITELDQLAHFSPEEMSAIDGLVETLARENRSPSKEDLELLRNDHKATDIAMFGRMLADEPDHNMDAATQVSHAISVHRITVEDDYFTAVDDLNEGIEDMGAAHIGETEFAAGLFYLYLCIDRELLKKNLSGDGELAGKALSAMIEAAATVAPTGKQNSFASRAYASYILCERGDDQPRSLSVAFLKPVAGTDMMEEAIRQLENTRNSINKVYGLNDAPYCTMNACTGEGTLQKVIACATEGIA